MLTMEELQNNILNHKYLDDLLVNGVNPFSKIQETKPWHVSDYLYHNLAILNKESYDYFIDKWKNEYNYKMNKYELRINAEEIVNLTLEDTPLWFIKQHREFLLDVFNNIDEKNIKMAEDFIEQHFNNIFSMNNILNKISEYYNSKPLDNKRIKIKDYLLKNIKKDVNVLNADNVKNINKVLSEKDFIKHFIKNENDLKKYLDITLWKDELNYTRGFNKENQVNTYIKLIPLINDFNYLLDEKYDLFKKMKQTIIWINEDSYNISIKKSCEKLISLLENNINYYKTQTEKELIKTILKNDNEYKMIQTKKRI